MWAEAWIWAENKNSGEGLVRERDVQEAWKSLKICTDTGGDCYPLKRSRVSTKTENCRESKLSLGNPSGRSSVGPNMWPLRKPITPQFLCTELGSHHDLRNWRWQHALEVCGNWSQLREKTRVLSDIFGFLGDIGHIQQTNSPLLTPFVYTVHCCPHLLSLVIKTTHVLCLCCWVFLSMSIHMRIGKGPEVKLEKPAEVTLGRG